MCKKQIYVLWSPHENDGSCCGPHNSSRCNHLAFVPPAFIIVQPLVRMAQAKSSFQHQGSSEVFPEYFRELFPEVVPELTVSSNRLVIY